MNSKFIVENNDLITPEEYDAYVQVALEKGLTEQDVIQTMVSKVSIEDWKKKD